MRLPLTYHHNHPAELRPFTAGHLQDHPRQNTGRALLEKQVPAGSLVQAYSYARPGEPQLVWVRTSSAPQSRLPLHGRSGYWVTYEPTVEGSEFFHLCLPGEPARVGEVRDLDHIPAIEFPHTRVRVVETRDMAAWRDSPNYRGCNVVIVEAVPATVEVQAA